MKAHFATGYRIIHEVASVEHHAGVLRAIPLPHPMHLPQVPAARRTIIAPSLATMRVEDSSTGTPCWQREGSRPAVYSGRMTRAEEERLEG